MHGVHRAIAVQSAEPVQVMSAGSAYFLGRLAACLDTYNSTKEQMAEVGKFSFNVRLASLAVPLSRPAGPLALHAGSR
jgi:hypothetical protein